MIQHKNNQKNPPLPENEIVLIINELSTKTHETTGNKPEKPEMINKPNIKPITAS